MLARVHWTQHNKPEWRRTPITLTSTLYVITQMSCLELISHKYHILMPTIFPHTLRTLRQLAADCPRMRPALCLDVVHLHAFNIQRQVFLHNYSGALFKYEQHKVCNLSSFQFSSYWPCSFVSRPKQIAHNVRIFQLPLLSTTPVQS